MYVSHGSVAAQLKCDGIFNNCFIANCPQYVTAKTCENRLISGKDMENDKVGHFLGHSEVVLVIVCVKVTVIYRIQ